MKVFSELSISGSGEELDRVLSAIDTLVASQGSTRWTRVQGNERGMGSNVRCYQISNSSAEDKSARLWIAKSTSGLYVSNIVPVQADSLGMDGYNQILSEFYASFVRPAADQIGLTAAITGEKQTLEDWTEAEVVKSLRSFSSTANRTTGSGHPSDKERWHRFIVASHSSARTLDSQLLKRWLIEEERWSEETAIDLVIEYEQGLDLLRYYDKHR